MGANAQTSVPAFTAGQVLTAAQVTQINTGIPVFASSTERDAAFGGAGEKTLAEGQYAYLEDVNQTQVYDGSSWLASGGKILQVVSVEKTDTFSTSSTSFVDLTGLSASITPSSTSSKIFAVVTAHGSSVDTGGGCGIYFNLLRGATHIGVATSPGNRTPVNGLITNEGFSSNFGLQSCAFSLLDNPATTSATTYKVQVRTTSSTIYVNRSSQDADLSVYPRAVSTITLYEVSL